MPDRITITIQLPQTLANVAELLVKVGDIWPESKVDVSNEDGWVVRVDSIQ